MNVTCRRSKAKGSVDSEEVNNGIASLLYFDYLTHKESMYCNAAGYFDSIQENGLAKSFF